jgi:hypothetical protein
MHGTYVQLYTRCLDWSVGKDTRQVVRMRGNTGAQPSDCFEVQRSVFVRKYSKRNFVVVGV